MASEDSESSVEAAKVESNDPQASNTEPSRTVSFANTVTPSQTERNETPSTGESYETVVEMGKLSYAVASFNAIVKPVFLTMLLSALSVIFISTEESRAAQEAGLANSYTVLQGETSSSGQQLGQSLVNGLVIVGVICTITFLIVILYKYRCMKILFGYMILASAMLLGFLSSAMFDVAIERYELNIDKPSYALFLYNFAVVGTASIFYSQGFPRYITQFYLIMTSVIVAWQLSHFDDWTAWMLLVLLALYDLYAVLTPCGPLRALVNLMQSDDAPNMPGLLYEASFGSRPSSNRGSSSHQERREEAPERQSQGTQEAETARPEESPTPNEARTIMSMTTDNEATQTSEADPSQDEQRQATSESEESQIGKIPLAIARLYNLPFHSTEENEWLNQRLGASQTDQSEQIFTARELCAIVHVVFPLRGGKIVEHSEQNIRGSTLYAVLGRHGDIKRILYVKPNGKVFQRDDEPEENDVSQRDSIKLGLGDFIFYSILVSKAALYSYASFVACTIVIMLGLGLTLVILAVKGQALPALPISIFLGVVAYLLTRYVIEDYLQEIFIQQTYV